MFLLRYFYYEKYGYVSEYVFKISNVFIGYLLFFLVWLLEVLFWNGYLFFVILLYYFELL